MNKSETQHCLKWSNNSHSWLLCMGQSPTPTVSDGIMEIRGDFNIIFLTLFSPCFHQSQRFHLHSITLKTKYCQVQNNRLLTFTKSTSKFLPFYSIQCFSWNPSAEHFLCLYVAWPWSRHKISVMLRSHVGNLSHAIWKMDRRAFVVD